MSDSVDVSGEECRRILDWLSTTDMEQKQQDMFSLHQEGTCSWFLQSEEFTGWLEKDEANPLLWCPGDRESCVKVSPLPFFSVANMACTQAGAGKTVMT